jgi:hypothetical protein
MNTLLAWLQGGDLRSDGAASQAAEAVLQEEGLIKDLMEGLDQADDVVRGRTMDALEKVARSRPDLIYPYFPGILMKVKPDQVMMVRMHAVMLYGHMAVYEDCAHQAVPQLLEMLDDRETFSRSWAIASLCIIARKYPQYHAEITNRIAALTTDSSAAIRTRVRKAMEILANADKPFPKGWIKSEKIRFK